jgi:hypothetical protein
MWHIDDCHVGTATHKYIESSTMLIAKAAVTEKAITYQIEVKLHRVISSPV